MFYCRVNLRQFVVSFPTLPAVSMTWRVLMKNNLYLLLYTVVTFLPLYHKKISKFDAFDQLSHVSAVHLTSLPHCALSTNSRCVSQLRIPREKCLFFTPNESGITI